MRATKSITTILALAMVVFIGCGGGSSDAVQAGNTEQESSGSNNNVNDSSSENAEEQSTESQAQESNQSAQEEVQEESGSNQTPSEQTSTTAQNTSSIIINHNTDTISEIPAEYINKAKENLHIIYQGASHSRQMSKGMEAFENAVNIKGRKGNIYGVDLSGNGASGELDMKENFGGWWSSITNGKSIYSSTATYLDSHPKVNVVFWMWCYQRDDWNSAGTEYETDIDRYISEMEKLISEYGEGGSKVNATRSAVTFVYATGPNMKDRDGTVENENKTVFDYNKRIRDFAIANNRVLFDFYDIESYSPEGVYYGDGDVNSADVYGNYTHKNDLQDNNYGFGDSRTNWAISWQNSHKEGYDYFSFETAKGGIEHSNAIDADRKVYAMWWLFARLAGWDGK